MVAVTELETQVVDLGRSATSSVKLSLGGSRRFVLRHNAPANALSVEGSTATVPGWTVGYNLQSKEVFVEHKNRPTKLGELTIRQRIPHQKLYLIPSPVVKLAVKPLSLLGKARAETTLTYDFMLSVGTLQQDVVVCDRYKASVVTNSKTGPWGTSLALTAKTGNSILSSVGLDLSRASGPVLKAEGSLLNGAKAVRLKADMQLQGRDTRVEVSPPAINKLRLSLTGSVRSADKQRKPSVVLGAKMELQ